MQPDLCPLPPSGAPTPEPPALAAWERLCDALAADPEPADALRHIEAAREAMLGPGLLTVNVDASGPQDPPGEIQLLRGWSSHPAAYPVGGRKRKLPSPWTEQLLRRGEVFIGEGNDALAAAFDDFERIRSLGLQAVINVPLLENGRCRATFNVLGSGPRWQREEIAVVRLLAALARPFALRLRRGQ